jgi:hypothetical protein
MCEFKKAIYDNAYIKVNYIYTCKREAFFVVTVTFLYILFVLFRLRIALAGTETCSELV